MSHIEVNQRVVRNPSAVWTVVDGDSLIIYTDGDDYFGFGVHASQIWELLERPNSISEIVSELVNQFEVSEEECTRDVREFIDDILEKKLILPAEG